MSQTGVVSWSQTAASNSSADSTVNWAEGQSPASLNDSARAQMASVAKYRDDNNGSLVTSGTSTAYTITTNQSFSSLTVLNAQSLRLHFHTTCGASPTLNVDGLGAKAIQVDNSNAVASGAIVTGSTWDLTYYNSISAFILSGAVGAGATPVGGIIPFAGSTAPGGWLICDGSAKSRTTYARLFAVISTTYGTGDGSTTFNLPDLGGRTPAGKEATATRLTSGAGGVDGGTLGAVGGAQTHTLTAAESAVLSYTSTVTDPGHTHTVGINPNTSGLNQSGLHVDYYDGNPSGGFLITSSSATGITVATASSNAGGGAHTSVQPTIVLNYIIYAAA